MEHLVKEVTNVFSIYKNRWIFISVSVALILVGVVFTAINGFNLDIDFAGGTSITFDAGQAVNKDEITALANETLGFSVSAVQLNAENPNEVTIKTKSLESTQSDQLLAAMRTKYNLAEDYSNYSVNSFTPAYGQKLANEALIAVGVAVALMLVYITIRFEFLSGLSAIIALIHDVLIMISVYAIFKIPVNASFIAVVLTILGYSINNTIVVFDRIRENKKNSSKESFAGIADFSIKQTLNRSINTTITTFVMVAVLYILGVDSIREFAFPLMVGIIGGAYSSLFIVSPVWAMFKGIGAKKVK